MSDVQVYRRVAAVAPFNAQLLAVELDRVAAHYGDAPPPVWVLAACARQAGVTLEHVFAERERRIREGQ